MRQAADRSRTGSSSHRLTQTDRCLTRGLDFSPAGQLGAAPVYDLPALDQLACRATAKVLHTDWLALGRRHVRGREHGVLDLAAGELEFRGENREVQVRRPV